MSYVEEVNEVALTDGTAVKMLQKRTHLKGEELQGQTGGGRNFAL